MMRAAIAEVLGTFIFVSAVMLAGSDPVLVGVALVAALVVASSAGAGHLNPAVTVAMYLRRKVTAMQLVVFVMSQLVGAILAVFWAPAA